jgi:hypothetical protein
MPRPDGPPLQITSRRHPLAVGVLTAYALWGSMLLCGWARSASMNEVLSGRYRDVLATTMLLSALTALAGIWWRELDTGFQLEAGGLLALMTVNVVLAATVFVSARGVVGTGIVCTSVAAFSLWRVGQIRVEWVRIRRSMLQRPMPTDPDPLQDQRGNP